MHAYLERIDEHADEDRMELYFVPIPPDELVPPQLQPLTPVEVFISDSSSEPDPEPAPDPDTAAVELVSSVEPIPLTLAQQLRAATIQATQLEAFFVTYNAKLSLSEHTTWMLQMDKGLLSDKLSELEFEMSLQAFDLSIQKGLVQFHESSRRNLLEQLTNTTEELLTTLEKLNVAHIMINDLQTHIVDNHNNELPQK